MGENNTVYDDIVDALEQNGSMTGKEQNRLMLLALNDIGRNVQRIGSVEGKVNEALKRLDTVEGESIVRWAKKNKKTALTIGFSALFFLMTLLNHMGLLNWFFHLIGLPVLPGAGP